jgi:hypothetical protein
MRWGGRSNIFIIGVGTVGGQVPFDRRQILADQGKSWKDARQTEDFIKKKVIVTV